MKPRPCAHCGAPIAKLPIDELVVGMLVYCTRNCRNLHLPSEHRRIQSLLLRALGTRRLPDAVRVLLVSALKEVA